MVLECSNAFARHACKARSKKQASGMAGQERGEAVVYAHCKGRERRRTGDMPGRAGTEGLKALSHAVVNPL